jgi:hypothetical protein
MSSSTNPQDQEKKTWWQEWKQKIDDFYLKIPSTEIMLNGVEVIGLILIVCFLVWFVLIQRENDSVMAQQPYVATYPGYGVPAYGVVAPPGYGVPAPFRPQAPPRRRTGQGRRVQRK